MAINRIQFQLILPMPAFLNGCATEAQFEKSLAAIRWPYGSDFPPCGRAAHYVLQNGVRKVFQCHACQHQVSLVARTVFQCTKLPQTVWFLAIYRFIRANIKLSALDLKRHLGVSYPTEWLMHHKLMQGMIKRENRYVLEVKVQYDDAYLYGESSGGKVGRCSENKVPFIAAVSVSDDGRPLRVKLTPVSAFKLMAISLLAQDHLVPDSGVLSDRLACFGAVRETACIHQPTGMAERKPKDVPEIK